MYSNRNAISELSSKVFGLATKGMKNIGVDGGVAPPVTISLNIIASFQMTTGDNHRNVIAEDEFTAAINGVTVEMSLRTFRPPNEVDKDGDARYRSIPLREWMTLAQTTSKLPAKCPGAPPFNNNDPQT